ncbi:MAG: MFS transporter [Betaproteobacteria bacterium]|nr:MFS transporter [Betaproteobacteria bacterium]
MSRLWPLTLGAFALGLDAYVLAGLLPGMARDLGTTQALTGLGVVLFTAAYAISAPALSFVAGRHSARKALLGGLALFTFGNAATMLAPSLAILLAARLLAGIGAGLYSPLAAASAAGMVGTTQRGRALALVLAGLSMGTALGVPVGLLIEHRLGWRWTIGLIVLIGLVAAAGVAVRASGFPVPAAIAWRDRLAALRAPFSLTTLSVTLWTGIASLGLYTYLAEVAAARGMAAAVPVLIWAWGLGGMAGAMLIGRVIDRHLPPARATTAVLTLLGIGFFLAGWGTPALVGAGCFLWGLAGWASIAPQQHALVTHDPAHATEAIAWNSSLNYLGGAIGAAAGSAALSAHLTAFWLPVGALVAVSVALALHLAKTAW